MKAENTIRKLDSLGRITIPKGLRDRMNWCENDEIEIYTDNDFVCLRKVGSEMNETAIKEGMDQITQLYLDNKLDFDDALIATKELVYNELKKNI